jgi:uncharacterized protein YndB with AHSA1/START domain
MNKRTTNHSTFVIERIYPASPVRVFNAWADPAAKARWFVGPGEWIEFDREFDFRQGGRERLSSGPPEGPKHIFDSFYHDIVPNQRIVYTYEMHSNQTLMSVSLATVEFEPAGAGTRLIFTEQAVFLDEAWTPADREQGTRILLDQLDAELRGKRKH